MMLTMKMSVRMICRTSVNLACIDPSESLALVNNNECNDNAERCDNADVDANKRNDDD